MPRETYVYREGRGVITKSEAYEAAATTAAFSVIRDGMDDARHPCTGEMMDSKSNFRRATKAAGCIEVGDQAHHLGRRDVFAEQRADRNLVSDIRRAIAAPDMRQAERYGERGRREEWNTGATSARRPQ